MYYGGSLAHLTAHSTQARPPHMGMGMGPAGPSSALSSSAAPSSSAASAHGYGGGPAPVHPVAVFRHIPHSASVDHAVVGGLAFSRCGLHAVAASRDRTLRLYDAGAVMLRGAHLVPTTGCEAVTFTHSSSVVAFSASHETDASVFFLDVATGTVLSGVADVVGAAAAEAAQRPARVGKGVPSTVAAVAAGGAASPSLSAHFRREMPRAHAFCKTRLCSVSSSSSSSSDENSDEDTSRPTSPAAASSSGSFPSLGGVSGTTPSPPPPTASASSARGRLAIIPTAASSGLALHPTTDLMASVRRDGWAQLIAPGVARPLALLKPTEEDEAYAARRRRRMRHASAILSGSDGYAHEAGIGGRASSRKTKKRDEGGRTDGTDAGGAFGLSSADYAAYSGIGGGGGASQGGLGALAGGGGFGGGPAAEACWFEYAGDHPHSSASFSPCGTALAVARSTSVALYDVRALGHGPTRLLSSASLLAAKGRFEYEPPTSDADTPVLAGAQLGAGGVLLATSTRGLSTLVDAVAAYGAECDFSGGVRVLGAYSGGGYAEQFFASGSEPFAALMQQQRAAAAGSLGLGAGMYGHGGIGGMGMGMGVGGVSATAYAFPAPVSCGAVFVNPSEGHRSMVVQPATRRAHGTAGIYPILIYEGAGGGGSASPPAASASDGSDAADSIATTYRAPGAGAVPAVISHQLLPRDVGPTRAIAVNPRFSLIASAANTVQWWTLGDIPRAGVAAVPQEMW